MSNVLPLRQLCHRNGENRWNWALRSVAHAQPSRASTAHFHLLYEGREITLPSVSYPSLGRSTVKLWLKSSGDAYDTSNPPARTLPLNPVRPTVRTGLLLFAISQSPRYSAAEKGQGLDGEGLAGVDPTERLAPWFGCSRQ